MSRKKLQYPSVFSVINVPVAPPITPFGGYFSTFDLVLKPKAVQQGSFNNTVQPFVVAAVQPYVFAEFSRPVLKLSQEGFITSVNLQPTQSFIFTQFSQPQQVKAVQDTAFDGYSFSTTLGTPNVFSNFSQPQVAKYPQVQQGFIGDSGPAQTPPWFVFSSLEQPLPTKSVQRPDVVGYFSPVNSTGPLVFSAFDQPRFFKVGQQPDVIFRILRPDAATPGPEVFSSYAQPFFTAKYPAHQQPGTSYSPQSFFVAPTPTFSGFSEFGFTQSKYAKQFDQSFVFVPQFQPYVFSRFDTPNSVRFKDDSKINFEIGFLGPAQTPIWSVFSPFKEPYPKKPQQDPSVGFIGDRGPAQVPPWFVFGPFEQPRPPVSLVDTQQFTLFEIVPATKTNPVFIAFDQPYNYRSVKEGQINFGAITTPTLIAPNQVFIPFDQPRPIKSNKDGQVYFALGVISSATQTPSPLVFSTFDQPKFYSNSYKIKEGQLVIDPIFIPNPPPPVDVSFHQLPFLVTIGPMSYR